MILGGMRILTTPNLLVSSTTTRRRRIRERLFSLPWRPWRSQTTYHVMIPDPTLYKLRIDGEEVLVCHPETLQTLIEEYNEKHTADFVEVSRTCGP